MKESYTIPEILQELAKHIKGELQKHEDCLAELRKKEHPGVLPGDKPSKLVGHGRHSSSGRFSKGNGSGHKILPGKKLKKADVPTAKPPTAPSTPSKPPASKPASPKMPAGPTDMAKSVHNVKNDPMDAACKPGIFGKLKKGCIPKK